MGQYAIKDDPHGTHDPRPNMAVRGAVRGAVGAGAAPRGRVSGAVSGRVTTHDGAYDRVRDERRVEAGCTLGCGVWEARQCLVSILKDDYLYSIYIALYSYTATNLRYNLAEILAKNLGRP